MNSKAICHCSEDRCPCEAIEDSHLAQCPMCDDWANITEGNWCNACLNYGPPERWTEVEVVTYDDCIAIMDEAIAKQCEEQV